MTPGGWGFVGSVAASMALAACGGGASEEPVNLDPTVLCNSAGAQPLVLNGASCGSYRSTPVVVLYIMNPDGETNLCSGTRISATEVLTAAHCVSESPVRVIAAAFKSDSVATGLDAKSWVIHPGYGDGGRFANDAAIVRFPAGLPNPTMGILTSESMNKGQLVYFAGWGLPKLESFAVGAGRVSSVGNDFLQIKYNGNTSDICSGDSGGPFYRMLNNRPGLVGITSNADSLECGANKTSSFTNIQTPSMLQFIQANAPTAAYF